MKKQERVVAVRRDRQGRMVEFKTSSGKIYDYEMAVEAIKNDELSNAELIKNKAGSNVIKGKNNQSFADLPDF